jgi:hypothetical protein
MIGSCVGRSRRELRRTRTLKIPRAERRRTIVFLGLDGHHNWGSEGAMVGAKWLTDHRDEVFAKTALMINCEHPSTVQTTVRPRYLDHNHPLVICMSSAVMSWQRGSLQGEQTRSSAGICAMGRRRGPGFIGGDPSRTAARFTWKAVIERLWMPFLEELFFPRQFPQSVAPSRRSEMQPGLIVK